MSFDKKFKTDLVNIKISVTHIEYLFKIKQKL